MGNTSEKKPLFNLRRPACAQIMPTQVIDSDVMARILPENDGKVQYADTTHRRQAARDWNIGQAFLPE